MSRGPAALDASDEASLQAWADTFETSVFAYISSSRETQVISCASEEGSLDQERNCITSNGV